MLLALQIEMGALLQVAGSIILLGVVALLWLKPGTAPLNPTPTPFDPPVPAPTPFPIPTPTPDTKPELPAITNELEGASAVARCWESIDFVERWLKHHKHSKALSALDDLRRDLFVTDTSPSKPVKKTS